jgi:protease-4
MFFLITFPLFAQAMYLELNLNKSFSDNPFALEKQPLEVFRVIERASGDNKVHGIILNIASVSEEKDYLWELRSALEQFKGNNKKIVAFISNADMDVYNLASVADKIVMDELGTLSMLGYSVGRGYAKHTLEKLGIGVRELRYFEYKSAAETFTRDSMSEADRRQYNDYLDDVFNLTRATLKNARNFTDEELDAIVNRDFIFSAKSAKEKNLIDYIGRADAVQQAVLEIERASTNLFSLYGDVNSSLTGSILKYSPPKTKSFMQKRPPVIAVVYADGQTDMRSGMAALNLSRIIVELADRRRVKAIVVRINSPGGSAEAADHFAEAVYYAKQKKPVIVSMGAVAASGGYWAAMNANHIFATPYTITGSIGVIGSWFYDNGFTSKLGVNIETLKRGAHSDLFTGFIIPSRDLGADEQERYKSYMMDIYDLFVDKAAAGRGMSKEKIEAAAQGRIFSGIRALDTGLIDGIGGLHDAMQKARELARIPQNQNIKFEEYPKPKFFERLLGNFPMARILFKFANKSAAANIADLFIPDVKLRYRLENNGKVMPILPLEFIY